MTNLPLRVNVDIHASVFGQVFDAKDNSVFSKIQGVCLDSRTVQEGDLFFAIEGARDGHLYVRNALEAGAIGAVVKRGFRGPEGATHFHVESPIRALQELAKKHRLFSNPKVLAVSGSCGKTTTKEMIASLMSATYSVHKSPGSWNNHLGIPLTLLSIQKTHEVVVLEMGMDHAGELMHLCDISQPDITGLTMIGLAHIEHFPSQEALANAKAEIFYGVKAGGTLVIQADQEQVVRLSSAVPGVQRVLVSTVRQDRDVYLKSVDRSDESQHMSGRYDGGNLDLELPLLGDHMTSNLAVALGFAKAMNLSPNTFNEALSDVTLPGMRQEWKKLSSGARVLMDCYNANPDSMDAFIALGASLDAKRKVFLIGDMAELGDLASVEHVKAGKRLAEAGIDMVLVLGQHAEDVQQGCLTGGMAEHQIHCLGTERATAEALLAKELVEGDVLMVKGSRCMSLEDIVQPLLEKGA